jgi:hypothetical protein
MSRHACCPTGSVATIDRTFCNQRCKAYSRISVQPVLLVTLRNFLRTYDFLQSKIFLAALARLLRT